MLSQSMAPRRTQEGTRPGALATAFAQGREQIGREMSVLPAAETWPAP